MKLKQKGVTPLLLFVLICSESAFALTPMKDHPQKHKDAVAYEPRHGYLEVIGALGVAALRAGDSELGVTSSETDRLVQTNNNRWNTFGVQFGVGYVYFLRDTLQFPEQVQWFTSVEPQLNVYYLSSNTGIEGDVYRFNDPNFNELTYNMPFHSTRLMLDVALTIAAWRQMSIYAIGGIGNAWNRMGYSDTDNNSYPCPEQRISLTSSTRSHFAWELGAGVDYALTDRIALSLEYLYTHFGNVETSSSGDTGLIAAPLTTPISFRLSSQTALLGLHAAL